MAAAAGVMRRRALLGAAAVAPMLAAPGARGQAPRRGGTLFVAADGEPNRLRWTVAAR